MRLDGRPRPKRKVWDHQPVSGPDEVSQGTQTERHAVRAPEGGG